MNRLPWEVPARGCDTPYFVNRPRLDQPRGAMPMTRTAARKADSRILHGIVLGLTLLLGACATGPRGVGAQERPTSVIFLISDGAGAAHWTLARYATEDLALERMKTIGLVDTRGSDHQVSGSAPTASAYATGLRTFMGAISVGPDSLPVKSVLEVAMERGMSTGLMTTTAIQDATPAAFGAHAVSRTALADISRQYVEKEITVLMGGGRRFFRPDMHRGRDLLSEARETYTYVESVEELAALRPDTVDMLLGLLAETEMGIVAERGAGTLRRMAATALEILDRDPDGFFLMVENEESDTQSHGNADQETITAEMLDFDEVVRLALDYQAEHPGTLVLVTGDHETGGLTLPYGADAERTMFTAWTTPGHTGTLLPIFAAGPGAEKFGGIIRNDRVGQVLMELLGANGR